MGHLFSRGFWRNCGDEAGGQHTTRKGRGQQATQRQQGIWFLEYIKFAILLHPEREREGGGSTWNSTQLVPPPIFTLMLVDMKAVSPNNRFEEVPDDPYKVGRVDQIERLEVLLVPSVKSLVDLPQPPDGRLVLGRQPVVEVHQGVVHIHVLVQGVHQVPGK